MTYNPFVVVSSVLMAPYIPNWNNKAKFSLFRQEQPYVSHQTPQKVLILVLAQ